MNFHYLNMCQVTPEEFTFYKIPYSFEQHVSFPRPSGFNNCHQGDPSPLISFPSATVTVEGKD